MQMEWHISHETVRENYPVGHPDYLPEERDECGHGNNKRFNINLLLNPTIPFNITLLAGSVINSFCDTKVHQRWVSSTPFTASIYSEISLRWKALCKSLVYLVHEIEPNILILHKNTDSLG